MLSELCVRRPVFATMLVMSLVVLGIFSFRDLGVDLFPRADNIISYYREGTEQDPVKVRLLENQRRASPPFGKLTVPSAVGPVRIDDIAQIERGVGPSQLQRFNHRFSIMLTADVAPGHALDEASSDVRRMVAELNMSPEYSVKLTGQAKILLQWPPASPDGRL